MTDSTRIPEGTYVELKPGRENVYKLAKAGSRGWVRKHQLDRLGYPMVWIEWDRDHPKSNGENDGWTFESHWNVLEDGPRDILEEVADLFDIDLEEATKDDVCPTCNREHVDRQAKFIDTLMEGVDEAMESEAFYLITVRQEPGDNPSIRFYIPAFFTAALTDEAQELLMTQVTEVVTAAFNEMSMERITRLMRKRKDEPGQ